MSLTATGLRVLDAPARPDLEQRVEHKYVFDCGDPGSLRASLLQHCRPLQYAGPVSLVHSLYFDRPDLQSAWDNLAGIGLRRKYRLRWYDTPRPTGTVFVENKWRRHQATGKHRLGVTGVELGAADRLADLRAQLCSLAPGHPAMQGLLSHGEPVLLVVYRREHFEVVGTPARLTLDYDLRFVPLLGQRCLRQRFAQTLPSTCLVEFKSPNAHSPAERRAVQALRARQARFSKYVTGCQRLGYLADL